MVRDNISDLLTRIRNAALARHATTNVYYSKINLAILYLLFKKGYIQSYNFHKTPCSKPLIHIILKYKGWWIKKPVFSTIKRISKPGKRIYASYLNFEKKISNLRYNHGIAIISTSNGIMSHFKAKKFKKGGEILCYIE